MPLKMIAVLGWTAAVVFAIGWFWQFVKNQECVEHLARSKARVDELSGGLRDANKERDDAFKLAREREAQAKKFGHEGVVRDVLPVIDDFERALQPAMASNHRGLLHGVRMVRKQLLDTLKRHGVEAFEAEGETFDPRRHEAVDQVRSLKHKTGVILSQSSPGYMINGRLLRAAKVTVAVSPSDDLEGSPETDDA